jgi:hypothetical protein
MTIEPVLPEEADTDEARRVRLASAPETAPDTLLGLASDPDVLVRAAVAINPSSPPPVDKLLAADPDSRVRTLLARKLANLLPSLSGAQYEHLQQQAGPGHARRSRRRRGGARSRGHRRYRQEHARRTA